MERDILNTKYTGAILDSPCLSSFHGVSRRALLTVEYLLLLLKRRKGNCPKYIFIKQTVRSSHEVVELKRLGPFLGARWRYFYSIEIQDAFSDDGRK